MKLSKVFIDDVFCTDTNAILIQVQFCTQHVRCLFESSLLLFRLPCGDSTFPASQRYSDISHACRPTGTYTVQTASVCTTSCFSTLRSPVQEPPDPACHNPPALTTTPSLANPFKNSTNSPSSYGNPPGITNLNIISILPVGISP